jgi:hypothetical protein
MPHYYALLSIVFMMGFVAIFDRMHVGNRIARFCHVGLMSQEEARKVVCILGACRD